MSLLKTDVMHYTKDNATIIIKGADKRSAVFVWDRDNYLKEAAKQLEDKHAYEEVQNYPSTLISTIKRALEKIRKRGDLSNDTLNYFLVKDPKFARFYLLLPRAVAFFSVLAPKNFLIEARPSSCGRLG